MYITMNTDLYLHWWGKDLLLLKHPESYYIFTEEEKIFVELLTVTSKKSEIIKMLSQKVKSSLEVVESFVEIFMENFKEYFYYSFEAPSPTIKITGRKDQYFPIEFHISLTSSCLQKCKHCYKSAVLQGKFINVDMLNRFLDKMKGVVPFISLSGGEPTLHPNFPSILKKFGKEYDICVLTSGYKLQQDLFGHMKSANRGIVVSIYSSYDNVHDNFVGVKGSYYEILKTLKIAASYNIPTSVTTFLTHENAEDIDRLVAKLTELEVRSVTLGTISPVGRALDNHLRGENDFKIISHNFINTMQQKYKGIQIVGSGKERINSPLPMSPFKCHAGTLSWAIYENGDIQPCAMCSNDEFSLGKISNFEESILKNRSQYIQKISRSPMIKTMNSSSAFCPFGIE